MRQTTREAVGKSEAEKVSQVDRYEERACPQEQRRRVYLYFTSHMDRTHKQPVSQEHSVFVC